MKLKSKIAVMLMCAAIGIQSSLPVYAAANGGEDCGNHSLHYVRTEYKWPTRYKNCVHCTMCTDCKDAYYYKVTVEIYHCKECGYEEHVHEELLSSSCCCDNGACCY